MNPSQYKKLTSKQPVKAKPRAKPLPKATQKYLEAEETLFQELEENLIGYRRKFQFESTRNWRFDFYIVKLNLLIEIVGSPWSVGRGGKKIANAFNKYDLAEDMGYRIERIHPDSILSGATIKLICTKFD
jgi:very-short-patch-repair endonuclease